MAAPLRHSFDRHVEHILAELDTGDPDDLFTTEQVAALLRMAPMSLQIGRVQDWGPPYIKVSDNCVRYMRRQLIRYLKKRQRIRDRGYVVREVA